MMRQPTDIEILKFMAEAYSFLLPRGTTANGLEYADLIARHYDASVPQTAYGLKLVRSNLVSIRRECDGGSRYFVKH